MIIDISQEVFSCKVFPGDDAPKPDRAMSIQKGDICNLTNFSMCAHNGTHADAPFHFIDGGMTIDRIPLDVFVGDIKKFSALPGASGKDYAVRVTQIIREEQ